MVDVEMIRKLHDRGKPVREIARITGWSRQTVRKHLSGPVEPPAYTLTRPRPSPVMDPYVGVIARWLEDDENAPKKQRHTARRIFDRLVDEYGFTGAEVTVRQTVAKMRGKRIEAFVPLEAPWGRIAQADFGRAAVLIAGKRVDVALFCMRAKASKVPFVTAFPNEKLEAFLQGHADAFGFFGGVFGEVWYDNPKTAVTRILAGPFRIEHERLSALRTHYLFDSKFCTPARGNEKGSVENLVGYVRRNALVPHTRPFPSLEALNAHLFSWCERERARHLEAWEIETKALRLLPVTPFRASTSRPVVASKTSMVTVDRVRYSVPVRYAGRTLRAECFTDRVEVYDKESLVAAHVRNREKDATVLELPHYLDAFERKPRAALSCAALSQADPVFTTVRDLALASPDGHRSFAAILLLAREFGVERLAEALRIALASGAVTPDRVRQIAMNALHEVPSAIEVPDSLLIPLASADLSRYDRLAVCTS